MKRWIPEPFYSAKPWVFMVVGMVLTIGMMGWSLWEGSWTDWRSFLCFVGAAMAVIGGVIQQLRQNYRLRSKWQREKTRQE